MKNLMYVTDKHYYVNVTDEAIIQRGKFLADRQGLNNTRHITAYQCSPRGNICASCRNRNCMRNQKSNDILDSAVRPYRHINGDGLVTAYDRQGTRKVVAELLVKIKGLEEDVINLLCRNEK